MNAENYGYGLKNLYLKFSNTKPNENANISGTYIDFTGNIHGEKSSTIIIQGGDNKGAYAINAYEPSPFFMTQAQRKTLTKIIKGMASFSDMGAISSENGDLEEMAIAIYRNFIG